MLLTITPTNTVPAISVAELQHRIEQSSNFRFAWQFFRVEAGRVAAAGHARRVLDAVVASPDCHEFLRQTFDPMYESMFTISSPHTHAVMAPADAEFPSIIASAAADHLGAYSCELRDATPSEAAGIRGAFSAAGPYVAFQLLPGRSPGCEECNHHNNHLFSSWFYGVAWDWCFVLGWPDAHLAWVGCLTDTD